MSTGILLREVESDLLLSKYCALVLDEVTAYCPKIFICHRCFVLCFLAKIAICICRSLLFRRTSAL